MNIPPGADLRDPQYRRETFLRFYEFHLKYRSHPAAGIYYVLPFLKRVLEWDDNRAIWFAFLEGNTHNPATSYRMMRKSITGGEVYPESLDTMMKHDGAKLAFDPDRRHQKRDFSKALWSYWDLLMTRGCTLLTQDVFWRGLWETEGWEGCWKAARSIATFGRLSAFSFLEYVRLAGVPLIASSAYLEDRTGSRTLRAGLLNVLGDDTGADIEQAGIPGSIAHGQRMPYFQREADRLMWDAALRTRMATDQDRMSPESAADCGWFTMESALCTYRGWFTAHGRYPGVYNDLLYNALKKHELVWGDSQDTDPIWEARASSLPSRMLLERNPYDPGYRAVKQTWFREHGGAVMMGREWPEMMTQFDRRVDAQFYPRRAE